MEIQQVLRFRLAYLMCRLIILPFLFLVFSTVAANSGNWVYQARGENEIRRKEVGITKKRMFQNHISRTKKPENININFLMTNALVPNK